MAKIDKVTHDDAAGIRWVKNEKCVLILPLNGNGSSLLLSFGGTFWCWMKHAKKKKTMRVRHSNRLE